MTTARNLASVSFYIRDRSAFNHRSMSGVRVRSGAPNMGDLPPEYQRQLRIAISETEGLPRQHAVYIVYSYGTPIAWVSSDRVVVIPDVTYSRTTTKHQTIAREALSHG